MIEDFESVFCNFMEQELPESITEEQLVNVSAQKTGLVSAFISGHLNLMNPTSKCFTKTNELLENNQPKKSALSGLILPDHLRT
jgi:hypothetical protein